MTDSFDVVCFGEILWDIFESDARSGEPIARQFQSELGGSPANVAVGLARLGVRSAIAGAIGNDRMGSGLKHLLATEHVATDFIVELPNRTGLTFVVRDPDGEPSFLPYRDAGADMAMTAAHVTPAMGRTTWGVVGTSTLLTPALAGATQRFLDFVRANNGSIFIDLNVRAHLWPDQDRMRTAVAQLLTHVDVVHASEVDLAALAGPRGQDWLEDHAKGATRIFTHGDRGATAVGSHGSTTAAAEPVRTVDATGAGDAFVAGVLAVLIHADARPGNESWKDPAIWPRALQAGNMMGAKAVASVGAVTGLTDLDAVRDVISGHERSSRSGT